MVAQITADALISIHTTLAGGDPLLDLTAFCFLLISIHTTLAGGDMETVGLWKLKLISIHTTLAGGDESNRQPVRTESIISIHTTLAGGDSKNGREIHPFSIPIKA